MAIDPADRRKNYRDSQDYYSSKLSDSTRAMSFGLCAVAFTLLSTDTAFADAVTGSSSWLLLIAAALGALSIVADSLQMLFGWFGTKRAAENDAGEYKADALAKGFFAWREAAFYLKLVFAFVGAAILVFVLADQIIP